MFGKHGAPREIHLNASLDAGQTLEITVQPDSASREPFVRISGSGKLDVAFPVKPGEGFVAAVISTDASKS